MLTGRQIDIVRLLREQEDFITIMQISQQIGVSQKTVRNDLAVIKAFCREYHMGAVVAKPHEGVMLAQTKEEWEQFLNIHENAVMETDTKADIKIAVIRCLLKKKSLNFKELEQNLYVSRGTIEKELPDVKKWFQRHDILFEKKRGKGLELFYTEFHFRMAVWKFAKDWKHMQEAGTGKQLTEPEIMANLLEGFDSSHAERLICEMEQDWGIFLSYESHQQLLFLMSLTVSRIRKKCVIEMRDIRECKTDSTYDIMLTDWLVNRLEKSYQITVLSQEKEYLLFLIRVSDIQGFSNMDSQQAFEIEYFELCCVTVKLANLLGEIISIDLKTDMAFVECLMLQLRSTIQRLRYGMVWKHPLLKQVKQKYPNIFAAVYAAGVFFDKELGMEINEHEMCCLALHLGGAVERNISILNACVVCNYGIGVSQLLRERIERNVTDLRIQDVFSVRDIKKIRAARCDLIIATLPLDDYGFPQNVVVVEHLLSAYDLKKIGDKMKQIRKEKLRTQKILGSVELRRELFNGEFVWLWDETTSKQDIIKKMCKALLDAGYVTEGFEESVFEHEDKAPTHLGMGVAIPHGYAKYVIRPVVAFASLKSPVVWEGNEETDLVFLLAFNLDEASGLKEETIKFYSVFLDLLDSDEELKRVRNITDKSALIEYMNQKVRGDKNI